MKLESRRREYLLQGLSRKNLNPNPIAQFEIWMKQILAENIPDATAMSLATVDGSGQPSQRTVLLKNILEDQFVFFTNLRSHKAKDIEQNNKVSLLFSWLALERQVKIQGIATHLSKAESLKYFLTRPRDSQLSAWASNQSEPVTSRKFLEQQFLSMKTKFQQGKVPLPDFWGGYKVKPTVIEFWQGRGKRLHDRFQYQLLDTESGTSWQIERLAP